MDYAECEAGREYKRREFVASLTAEQAAKLPDAESWLNDPYDVEILDRFTGKTHQSRVTVNVENEEAEGAIMLWPWRDGVTDADRWMVNWGSLAWHFCGCHRESSITDPVPDEPGGDDCPKTRFVVTKVIHRNLPDVVVYYEQPVGEYTTEKEKP